MVIGPMMVAKESRFIEEVDNDDLKQFHAAFCKTQQKANRIAVEFNKRLAMIPGVTFSTPRIRFLDCTVYMLYDVSVGRAGVLVEKMLDNTRYKKWNSNNGWTDGMRAGEHLAVGPGRH